MAPAQPFNFSLSAKRLLAETAAQASQAAEPTTHAPRRTTSPDDIWHSLLWDWRRETLCLLIFIGVCIVLVGVLSLMADIFELCEDPMRRYGDESGPLAQARTGGRGHGLGIAGMEYGRGLAAAMTYGSFDCEERAHFTLVYLEAAAAEMARSLA